MKISEVITRAQAMRPTQMKTEDMALLLCNLDLHVEEMMRNVYVPPSPQSTYGTDPSPLGEEFGRASYLPGEDLFASLAQAQAVGLLTSEDKTLLLPAPYDETYVHYLAAQIDYYNREMDLYTNDAALYTASMREARAWWRRDHAPKDRTNWVV